MLLKACEYGIRALVYIVSETEEDGKRVDIKKMSSEIDSPHHFTAKILQQLTKAKIISSLKGPNGGFYANEKTGDFSLMDVITVMGGEEMFSSCLLGLHECSEQEPCPLHEEYKVIRGSMNELFKNTSLRSLTTGLDKKLHFLK